MTEYPSSYSSRNPFPPFSLPFLSFQSSLKPFPSLPLILHSHLFFLSLPFPSPRVFPLSALPPLSAASIPVPFLSLCVSSSSFPSLPFILLPYYSHLSLPSSLSLSPHFPFCFFSIPVSSSPSLPFPSLLIVHFSLPFLSPTSPSPLPFPYLPFPSPPLPFPTRLPSPLLSLPLSPPIIATDYESR